MPHAPIPDLRMWTTVGQIYSRGLKSGPHLRYRDRPSRHAQQVMDERRQVVWQADTTAFGQARVMYTAAMGANGTPFMMNMGLPGQVYDTETNLHYNYLRDYDPTLGRYTSPDPAGLSGGLNPYVYVSNNPLINVDPLGLYEEDIHYYMTYFLALAAGVDPRRAYIIATADQYIDDNPITQPMAPSLLGSIWEIISNNAEQENRLASYHFTERVADDWSQNTVDRYIMKTPSCSFCKRPPRTGASWVAIARVTSYLVNIFTRSKTRSDTGMNTIFRSRSTLAGATQQADTRQITRITKTSALQARLSATIGNTTKPAPWKWRGKYSKSLRCVRFNAVHEDSAGTDHFAAYPNKKIDKLNVRLNEFGYSFAGMDGIEKGLDLYDVKAGRYSELTGQKNRDTLLKYNKGDGEHKAGDAFKKDDPNFKGTILP